MSEVKVRIKDEKEFSLKCFVLGIKDSQEAVLESGEVLRSVTLDVEPLRGNIFKSRNSSTTAGQYNNKLRNVVIVSRLTEWEENILDAQGEAVVENGKPKKRTRNIYFTLGTEILLRGFLEYYFDESTGEVIPTMRVNKVIAHKSLLGDNGEVQTEVVETYPNLDVALKNGIYQVAKVDQTKSTDTNINATEEEETYFEKLVGDTGKTQEQLLTMQKDDFEAYKALVEPFVAKIQAKAQKLAAKTELGVN